LIRRSLAVLLLLGLPALAASAAETLRVLAWPGYADADLVQNFEKETGARVEVSLVGTDEALWEKISANGGGDFDVFAVNTAELQRYIAAGLTQPVIAAKIPRLNHQLPRFQDRARIPGIMHERKLVAVPYAYAEMGLIYDRRALPTPPDSIAVLWDPRFRGRILAYDGASHNFSLAAIKLAKASPFRLQEADWAPLIEQLIALRRNVLSFYALPEDSVELFRQNKIVILFANYGTQQLQMLKAAGLDVGYTIPREGALAWLDCWAVTAGSKNPALANAWINFTLSPEASRALTLRHGLGNTLVKPAGESPGDHLVWLEPVEDPNRRGRLWQQIISGDRPGKVLP
jgi:putative spermidine/putrescine transport system substrate-binding protein